MLIDCDGCLVRGFACGDCVVSALLGGPPDGVAVRDGTGEAVHVDAVEVAALDALAAGGLVPPLRLVLPDTGTG
jgi:hypothetical protein